jgi:hypothetical protein
MSGLFSATLQRAGKRRRQALHQGVKKSTTTRPPWEMAASKASGLAADNRFAGVLPSHLEGGVSRSGEASLQWCRCAGNHAVISSDS